ncbi:hypothetical protein D9M72_364640 [compost metagenome]
MLDKVGALGTALVFGLLTAQTANAGAIAKGGKLELDHLRAHFSQDARAGRTRHDLGNVQHTETGEHRRIDLRHVPLLSRGELVLAEQVVPPVTAGLGA